MSLSSWLPNLYQILALTNMYLPFLAQVSLYLQTNQHCSRSQKSGTSSAFWIIWTPTFWSKFAVGSLSRSREAYRSATLPPRHTVTHKQMSLLINTHNEHTQASLGLQNSTVRQYLSDDLCWGETHTRNYAFLHRCLGVTRSFFSLTSTSLAPPICYQ
jgi:hypothetical protein